MYKFRNKEIIDYYTRKLPSLVLLERYFIFLVFIFNYCLVFWVIVLLENKPTPNKSFSGGKEPFSGLFCSKLNGTFGYP